MERWENMKYEEKCRPDGLGKCRFARQVSPAEAGSKEPSAGERCGGAAPVAPEI